MKLVNDMKLDFIVTYFYLILSKSKFFILFKNEFYWNKVLSVIGKRPKRL